MIAGYHLIWTVYGVWLPNDPRGSSSHEIRSSILEELGELHHGRKKIQPCSAIIREFYQKAGVSRQWAIFSVCNVDTQLWNIVTPIC